MIACAALWPGPGGVSLRLLLDKKVNGSASSSLSLSASESEFVTALMPFLIMRLLELVELMGTLESVDVDEKDSAGGRGGASGSLNTGGEMRGEVISAASTVLDWEEVGLLYAGFDSAAPSICTSWELFLGAPIGNGREGDHTSTSFELLGCVLLPLALSLFGVGGASSGFTL